MAFILDFFVSENLKKDKRSYTGELDIWENILHGDIQADIFIYGSSRAVEQIDPEVLERCLGKTAYNFGFSGQKSDLQLVRNRLIQEKLSKPEYIIYSLDSFMLMESEGPTTKEQFYPYMLFNEKLREDMKPYPKAFSTSDFYVPLLRYRGVDGLMTILQGIRASFDPGYKTPIRNKGYIAIDEEWNGDFEKMKKSGDKIKINNSQQSVNAFEAYLQEELSNGIKIILVVTPQYSGANNIFEGQEKTFALFEEWSKKYDIPYFNYMNDSICSKKEYFYNALHLNKKGSQLFSKKLAEDISAYKEKS